MSRVEILSNRCNLFKAERMNTILPSSLTTTTGSCCSEPHDQKLKYRDVAFFPMNPKYEWLHRSLQSLCSFLSCTQLNPSTDWDIAGSRDCGDPQGRWGTRGGWSSLPQSTRQISCFIPLHNVPFAPFQVTVAPLAVKQHSQKPHRDRLPLLINIKWGESNFFVIKNKRLCNDCPTKPKFI